MLSRCRLSPLISVEIQPPFYSWIREGDTFKKGDFPDVDFTDERVFSTWFSEILMSAIF